MSSEQIYYTYYSPTDRQHPNKVKYTENLSNAGDLLVTSSSGFENLNARDVITSSWGDGIQKQNDFNYNVSVTNGFKFNSAMVNNIQVVSASSNIANTIAKQITIDDFDYDTIFGLTRADPSVIDTNYYTVGDSVFTENNYEQILTNKETTRIGPRLFIYKGDGNLNDATVSSTSVLKTFSANYISKYVGKTVECGGKSESISLTTQLKDIETAWPYKIQYNANQWYHILTNGQKSALLTLPYWDQSLNTGTENNTERYYILNVTKSKNGDPIYSYYKLDKIVENNYYYIVSYFDTRPTIKNSDNIVFDSYNTSLFNENVIQIMPLQQYDYLTNIILHDKDASSTIASCLPLSFTTAKSNIKHIIDSGNYIISGDPEDTTKPSEVLNNFGLNPIAIKYEKNITITTTLNYTIANMTNLSNILTGWNYLHKDFQSDGTLFTRGNLPYINAGILVYIPTNRNMYQPVVNGENNTKLLNYRNRFVRYVHWLESFKFGYIKGDETTTDKFWNNITGDKIYGETGEPPFQSAYVYSNSNINYIYKCIESDNGKFSDKNLSTPAFIRFCDATYDVSGDKLEQPDDHIEALTTSNDVILSNFKNISYVKSNNAAATNFCDITTDNNLLSEKSYKKSGSDVIKFINTLSVPINNALNTTHTAVDTYTFRLSKTEFDVTDLQEGEKDLIINTDYFYIIGTYIYITKNLPAAKSIQNPHYLGFSPSTNITTKQMNGNNPDNHENPSTFPIKSLNAFMSDSAAPFANLYNNTINDGQTKGGKYALMKDIFVTPSLYMTLNESVGDV